MRSITPRAERSVVEGSSLRAKSSTVEARSLRSALHASVETTEVVFNG
jgi:hypothetical protein